MTHRTHNLPLAVFAMLACIGPTNAAAAYSQLLVFGDSLSDVGNIQAATAGIYPGDGYFNGRFSNGPVFTEALSVGLGLGPSIRSTAGGDNYAYGGARTAGTGGLEGLFIRDINEQVSSYLPRTTDPNALFLIFAGANDLLASNDVNIPVNNLAADFNRLINDGAQKFLVLNQPLLGYTPRFNQNPADFASYNTRSQQFNAALATMLDSLETNNPAIEIVRYDVAALFADAIANPQWFSLVNAIDSAAPGLQPGMGSYDEGQIVPNPHQYVFWDDLHPTAIVHAILAERVQMQLRAPGDFNRDEFTDAADYVAWRKRLAAVYTPPDFERWFAAFGHSPAVAAALPVPEPPCCVILAACAAFAQFSRRRYNGL